MSISDAADVHAFRLGGGREAGAAGRRALVAADGELPTAVRDDVLLLLTELVTNAVRHADPGTGFARIRSRSSGDHLGGWGPVLVDRIASRWGVRRGVSGTSVWFEVDFER